MTYTIVKLISSLLLCLLAVGCTGLQSDPVSITGLFAYTAPGDDGMSGQASRVQIRMALTSDSLVNNWASCQIISDHVPAPGGVYDTIQASFDIETGVMYYFALKAADERPNWSPLSNIITRVYPDITAPSIVADFDFGD